MKKKTIAAAAAAAIFIAALVAAVIFINANANKSPNSKIRKHSIAGFYAPGETRTHFIADGAVLSDNIAGNIGEYFSVDGQAEIIRAATALYRADKEKILLLHPAAVDKAALSLDNRYILFNTPSKILVYDHEQGKSFEFNGIPDDFKSILSLVISPNGQTYAVSVLEKDDLTLNTYICVNSEAELPNTAFTLCKENSCVCAVSDDGKIVYYMETVGQRLTKRLFREKNGKTKLIAENVEANFEINRTLTEITFDIKGKTYCSVNGGKPGILTGSSCFSSAGECYSLMGGEFTTVRLKDTDTLLNSVFYTYYPASDKSGRTYTAYDLYYVNSSGRGAPLAKGATQFSISGDEKTLLALVDSDLCFISVYEPEKPVKLFSNVYSYCADYEMNDIYFIDSNALLWYAPRGGKRELIAENAAKSLMGDSGVCCFMSEYDYNTKRGRFNTVKNGKTEFTAENVNNFETFAGMTLYYIETGEGLFDVYSYADGGSYKALSGVSFGNPE